MGRKAVGLPGLECVVIESHWPEYEATWKAIEARVTGAQAQPAPSVPDGWLRAIDEALVATHLGVANADDSYEAAKRKLNELIGWHTDVATDPAVNGGFKLVPADAQPAPSVPTALLVAVANLVAQMEIVSRVGFVDTPNDKDSCAAFCVAEGTWLELMSAVESLASALAAAPGGQAMTLSDEQIQDLLRVGNPTDEECRLIRMEAPANTRSY